MDFTERTFQFSYREYELLERSLLCKIDKLKRDIKEYEELNEICRSTFSDELNDFTLLVCERYRSEVSALQFELSDLNALYDRFFLRVDTYIERTEGGEADEK